MHIRLRKLLCLLLAVFMASENARASFSLLPEFSPRETSVQEREFRRAQALKALSSSRLAAEFYTYLNARSSPIDTAENARRVVRQIFDGSGRTTTSLSALQLMIDDSYRRGRLDAEKIQRLTLLQSYLMERENAQRGYPGEGAAFLAIATLLAALPLGSPVVRNAMKQLVRAVARRLGFMAVFADAPTVTAARFFSWDLFRTYEIKKTIANYFKWFGPISMVFFFWYDWREQALGHSVFDEISHLTSREEWLAFLQDLTKL